MTSLHLDRTFRAQPGDIVEIIPGVRRVTADNPGAMTFVGTNSFLVGTDELVIIDPGPDDARHLQALLRAIGAARVAAILVTHTHRDHSPLARALGQAVGAPIMGAGPHVLARAAQPGDGPVDEAADLDHTPDTILQDGQMVRLGGVNIEAVATPGHTTNHLCLALGGTDILFSGDHVMAWSTTLVAPPDGSMTAYLASLQKLLARPQSFFLPAHGARLADAKLHTQALYDHRLAREAAILEALECEQLGVGTLVDRLYHGLDGSLRRAAGLSVLAHLERLEDLRQAFRLAGSDTLWTAGPTAFDRRD